MGCLAQLTANFVIMDKLLQFLLFLLPFVVESALVRNNIHILRKKILGRNIYDHHVKPDGKVDVSFGIDFMDMDLCPHKQMLSTTVFEKMMWFGYQTLHFTILLKHQKCFILMLKNQAML